MKQILLESEGTVVNSDGILTHGKNIEEQNVRWKKVLHRLQDAEITLNADKCKFAR